MELTQINDSLGKYKLYLLEFENLHIIIHTAQNVSKYISNAKRTSKNTYLLSIIQNKYTIELLRENVHKNEIETLKNKFEFEINKNLSIQRDLKHGKEQEHIVLEIINKYFQNDIIKMSNNKYSIFDYLGLLSHFAFELKSNLDKFADYPTAIIGVNKIIPNVKQIFLFQFKPNNDTKINELYYFIKPDNFEQSYNKRAIYLRTRNITNTIYDIPRTELIKIDLNEPIELPISTDMNKMFNILVHKGLIIN